MSYGGKKRVLLYIAMIMSAISGVMVLMPIIFIHRIITDLILNEMVDFAYVRENSIYAAVFAGLGLFIYLIGSVLPHIFGFEAKNIINPSVKKLMKIFVKKLRNEPLGYFDNKESGKKRVLLYIAMIMSAISGVMVLMPMVFIHRIVNNLILNEMVDFAYVRENSIYAAVFAGLGLFIYLIGLVLSHIFAFEVEDNIIKTSVKKLMNKPLGYFDNKESGRIRSVIVSGASETHSFLAHQLPDMAMTVISPIVLLVFFFIFNWKLGLASMLPMMIGMILMSEMMTSEIKKMKDERTVELELIIEKMSWLKTVSTSTAFFLVPVALLLIKFDRDLANMVADSVIFFLIWSAFAIFIMRTATITQFSYFAELALDEIENILEKVFKGKHKKA